MTTIYEIYEEKSDRLGETRTVAFCPDCLVYGTPMGTADNICGNCGKENLRHYIGYKEAGNILRQSFIAMVEGERAYYLNKVGEGTFEEEDFINKEISRLESELKQLKADLLPTNNKEE